MTAEDVLTEAVHRVWVGTAMTNIAGDSVHFDDAEFAAAILAALPEGWHLTNADRHVVWNEGHAFGYRDGHKEAVPQIVSAARTVAHSAVHKHDGWYVPETDLLELAARVDEFDGK